MKTYERCDHVFRSKRKAEGDLREKAMKRMRAVESDSVKSARKSFGGVSNQIAASATRVQHVHVLKVKMLLYKFHVHRTLFTSAERGVPAKDKLHKACERASEICERTLHRQEQNRMRMASMRES